MGVSIIEGFPVDDTWQEWAQSGNIIKVSGAVACVVSLSMNSFMLQEDKKQRVQFLHLLLGKGGRLDAK